MVLHIIINKISARDFAYNLQQGITCGFRLGFKRGPLAKAAICSVQALIAYLAVHKSYFNQAHSHSRNANVSSSTAVIRSLPGHLQLAIFSCIGAATTAAKCDLEDSLIPILGRWKSNT